MIKTLKDLGHTVISDHVLNNSIEEMDAWTTKDRTEYHRKMSKAITTCDLAVCEVSFPSTISIGHEVTLALDKGKPVIGLYQPGKEPGVLQGIHSDKFMMYEYDAKNLAEVLEYAMDEASEKIDVRYNFFISPKMARFLDVVAKDKKLPRAVYLRQLIEEDMKESGYKE